jgi:hypothetical protein
VIGVDVEGAFGGFWEKNPVLYLSLNGDGEGMDGWMREFGIIVLFLLLLVFYAC